MAQNSNPSIKRIEQSIQLLESFFGEPEQNPSPDDLLGLLIHIILSQSTSDINSGRAYKQLCSKFPTHDLLAEAEIEDIQETIHCAGLYRQKSRNIKEILNWVESEFGKLNIDEICSWPVERVLKIFTAQNGIGVKTVAVLLSFGCGHDIFPVDTHVHRISKRLKLVAEKSNAGKTFEILNPLIPHGKSYSFHVNLLKLGRRICLAKNTRCSICPLKNICPSVNL